LLRIFKIMRKLPFAQKKLIKKTEGMKNWKITVFASCVYETSWTCVILNLYIVRRGSALSYPGRGIRSVKSDSGLEGLGTRRIKAATCIV
jgi:hypothetical protein